MLVPLLHGGKGKMRICVLLFLLSTIAVAWDEVPPSLMDYLRGINEAVHEPYEEMLQVDPELEGTITLHFSVMPDGTIWDVELEADSCLVDLLPIVADAMDDTSIELEEPIIAPVPVTVPMELRPGI